MNLNRLRNFGLLFALMCVMTLMACGGGGGGGDAVTTPTPTPTATPTPTPTQLNILQVQVSEDVDNAVITWLTDRAATDVVQYGTTDSYGSQVTNATAATSHRVELTGLADSTPYYFQITSTDPDGDYLDDVYQDSFTTVSPSATPTPTPAITSDDFDGTTLDEDLWTFYDPIGLSTVSVSGGNLSMSLPSGTAHDAWEPNNYAARLMQTVNNENFVLTVTFVSPVNQAFQDQGIMIEEDGSNWLRFDVYYNNGDEVKMYVARIFDTDADDVADITVDADLTITTPSADYQPYYLRVTRTGTTWSFDYSLDGSVWSNVAGFSHTMTVNAVGPYAGNYSINSSTPVPAHEALVASFDVVINP